MLVMANLAANNGVPGVLALLHRHRRRHRLRTAQRPAGHPAQAAAVHRHPGHAEHLHRDRAALLRAAPASGERDMPPILNLMGTPIPIGPFRLTVGVVVVAVLAAVVVAFVLSQTAWGRHVYAVGDDIEAARLVGIRVDRVLLSVYTVAGLIYGLTAWVLIGRAGTASPNAIVDANLETHHRGGDRRHQPVRRPRRRSSAPCSARLIVYAFNIGLSLAGVDDQLRVLAIGVLIIVAVSIDQWIRKVKA